MFRSQASLIGLGPIECRDNGLFNLGTRKPVADLSQRIEIEATRCLIAPAEMDTEYLTPLPISGQVDKEDLVQAPFANKLGWSRWISFAVATTKTPVLCSAIQVSKVPRMRWETPSSLPLTEIPFFDLIDPENTG